MPNDPITRRQFVGESATFAAGAMIVPRHVLGRGYQAPSDTLNFAVIGMGQQGTENTEEIISENLIAVADVDLAFATRNVNGKQKDREGKDRPKGVKLIEQFGRAAKYTDFRELLDRQRTIDAVLIATPDHLHAVIAKAAMEMGKHVFVQKPLTYSVHEARVLRKTAERTKVVTQMGNQGHSSKEARQINEWIQAGVIGPVRTVHIWTNRPIWPQGIQRPMNPEQLQARATANRSWNRGAVTSATAAGLGGSFPPPEGLRWDLYLGPVPEDVPYHPIYHPFNWRGWVDFGVGALGDMGAHLVDHPYWALQLGYPTSIQSSSTPWGSHSIPAAQGSNARPTTRLVSYPMAMTAHYVFPARTTRAAGGSEAGSVTMPEVDLYWYDGGLIPPRPDVLPLDLQFNPEGGVLYIGEKGVLLHETYGRNPKLFPQSLMEVAKGVPEKYPRIADSHHMNWVNAIKGKTQASSPFSYAAALTEVMLLGIAALRAGQGRKLMYDAEKMEFKNAPDANQYLTREYRPGWAV